MKTRAAVAAAYMLALGALFCSSYTFAEYLASHRSHVPSIAFEWEHNIPFLPWTIVPYWSIDLLYCLSFFVCKTREELDRHAHRLLTAQILCVSAFLLFPLRFSFARPVATGSLSPFFQALARFDSPFNQAPSLHLSLAVILAAEYSEYLKGPVRWLSWMWFALIGVSALTTYQHHFFDIPTGIWTGLFCCAAFPEAAPLHRETRHSSSWKLSSAYAGGFLLLIASAVWLGGWAFWLLWPAGSCLIVSGIYAIGDPGLFRKRGGKLQPAMQWLLAPYTLAAWLNSRWWTRHDSHAVEIADGVWLGRLPAAPDLSGFQSVVDLTAELPIPRTNGVEYRNIPMLDLTVPTRGQLDRAVTAIDSFADSRPTLVCCALGYSRSPAAVEAWLRRRHNVSTESAS